MRKIDKKKAHIKRMNNVRRQLLKMNKICIVNLNDPYLFQTTMHHGNCRLVSASPTITATLFDIKHQWTVYLAVFCRSGSEQYTKAVEVFVRQGCHADDLADVIRERHLALVNEQNQNHVMSSGWIAVPYDLSLTVEHADAVFSAAMEASKYYRNEHQADG